MGLAVRTVVVVLASVIIAPFLLFFDALGGRNAVGQLNNIFLIMIMLGILWSAVGAIGGAFLTSMLMCMFSIGCVLSGNEHVLRSRNVAIVQYSCIAIAFVVSIWSLSRSEMGSRSSGEIDE